MIPTTYEQTYANVQEVLAAIDEMGAWKRSGNNPRPTAAAELVGQFFGMTGDELVETLDGVPQIDVDVQA